METIQLIYDARGNGGGAISPTITGDHENRITDYTAIVLETEMSYQETTGTLSPGAHAGSYNGQDAYNDMLVTEDVLRISSDRSVQGVGGCIGSENEGLQGRDRLSDRGGWRHG